MVVFPVQSEMKYITGDLKYCSPQMGFTISNHQCQKLSI